jgi:threonine synthase
VPPVIESFLRAYGAVVLPVPWEARWPLTRQLVDRLGLHPVSNLTVTHTGHPFGPEGYKTIAYEIHAELGVPAAVFVPTGYGELLFGLWKGFAELCRLGLTARTPRLYACESAAAAPLATALRTGRPAAHAEVGATGAYSIVAPVSGYRGVVAVRDSGGRALVLADGELRAAQAELAGAGLWTELSAAAGLAGLRSLPPAEREALHGPVVCISTSSGFKDLGVGTYSRPPLDGTWEAARPFLRSAGLTD